MSSSGVSNFSNTTKPTRALNLLLFGLNTKVCFAHLTNCPRTKYTPDSTDTAEPICTQLSLAFALIAACKEATPEP